MSLATARCLALTGAEGHLIDVQVDISQGTVGTFLVGRPDRALQEARDRVRMAINNSVPSWPATRRVTILLTPADLPKSGTHFDLAIAVAVKAADQSPPREGAPDHRVPPGALDDSVFIGELTLSGHLRPVRGVLPMVLAARARGITRVFVPEPQAREAAMVPDMTVFGMRSLSQVVAQLRDEPVPEAPPVEGTASARLLTWRGQELRDEVDMADVEGMEEVIYAVTVAAAGGHHLMLSGPRGAGKTTVAERIPTVLPDLTLEESLEVTAVHSLVGALDALVTRPPFFAPHHDASRASVLGGGTGRARPGEVSLAHHGVLFLDEFPLFRSDVIDSLRQPLEAGEVTIARGEESSTYPARAMVVLAANPCPCGNFHAQAGGLACDCLDAVRRHYQRKLSGPVVDRIDVWRELTPMGSHRGRDPFAVRRTSADVRAVVIAARARQAARFAGLGFALNSAVPSAVLAERWPLPEDGQELLDEAMSRGRLSRRGVTRVHRLALSVADVACHETPDRKDVETALALRTSRPVPVSVLRLAS
ncbi:YifB family Mg chelatase-like AAA ATPase [Nocardioides piscis]|uniref:YifB family Mg chelatase-like AAA ATPase n=1 Tax=Nocardioides piscis TaxID=2714938 RepID=A0A6G7YJQ7_9ACTN|nr:YifB family Mg chelatase-like AAA ATPase [Nocardioides piscis]QIK76967.1 YifB family Mg chelatase-like AAA ATPase [Nocardioides piscis]